MTSILLTDLYQLTMLQTYLAQDMQETAVFDFYVRRLPPQRPFLLATGLEDALQYLESVRFTPEELAWLARSGRFDARFLDYVKDFRFIGEVHALPEGTVFFANEPVLRITAPLPVAQLVETRLINIFQYQIMVASKAAQVMLAARGRQVVDFGLRRAHGADAGLAASRAAYIGGFDGSANVLADMAYGIPCVGTMAHSFILAHDDEMQAFENYARTQPDNVTLLIDTWNTAEGARKVVELAPRLAADGIRIKGVRIDSGDLEASAREVRAILDQGGQSGIAIVVSGDLDEHSVRKLVDSGAPIDGFGVGTRLVTCADRPYLECAYKLQEYAGKPRQKRSTGKVTWPGRKQVFRHRHADGTLYFDTVALEHEQPGGEPLLQCVMRDGQRTQPAESTEAVRQRARRQIDSLPESLKQPECTEPGEVRMSDALKTLAGVA